MLVLKCDVPVVLANLFVVDAVAVAVYLALTRGLGTPFADALERYPELARVKAESAKRRRNIYLLGLAVGVAAVVYFRPFWACGGEPRGVAEAEAA
jgi:hypothetical protein